jgi:putative spermidine/putrescine transport system permease protein
LQNYIDIFSSGLTANLYYETVKFTILTWLFSLIIGFWVAYFLVFHIRSPLLAIGLFLLCTVPFWTSNIIRMISWIQLLGKEGLINMALIKVGVIHEPLEFLLFSGFSVVVAYVHQLVGVLQYPTAAASAVALTILVTLIVTAILRRAGAEVLRQSARPSRRRSSP